MHKLFNAWCERFGGGKPVTAFRFFFKGKLIDGEQTAADIDIRRAIDLDVADYINVTSLPEVTLPITRSNSKKIRENVRRLPHEVEATLPSWVKCTDPIPREILEACVGAPGSKIENFSDLRNQRVGKENCAFPEQT